MHRRALILCVLVAFAGCQRETPKNGTEVTTSTPAQRTSTQPGDRQTADTGQPPDQGPASGSALAPDASGRGAPAPLPGPARPGAAPQSKPVASGRAETGANALRGAESAAPSVAEPAAPQPRFREVTIATGTVLPVRLETGVASDTSRVEDAVRGELRAPVLVDGVTALASGTRLEGVVTDVVRPGKVKGRALLALRFTSMTAGDEQLEISTATIRREARSTAKKDTAKIGIPAAGGAAIGGILGGKKGAAIGAGVGGGAGTAVVLTTRGEEVQVPAGTSLSVRLTGPLTLRVPVEP